MSLHYKALAFLASLGLDYHMDLPSHAAHTRRHACSMLTHAVLKAIGMPAAHRQANTCRLPHPLPSGQRHNPQILKMSALARACSPLSPYLTHHRSCSLCVTTCCPVMKRRRSRYGALVVVGLMHAHNMYATTFVVLKAARYWAC